MNALVSRFKSLPRAARWLLLFLGLIVLPYFAVIEPALNLSADLASRADLLQASLRRSADRAARAESAGQSMALGQARFGGVKFPGDARQVEALSARIQEVIDTHKPSNWSQKTQQPALLGRDTMAGVLAEGEQVQRVQVRLEFEATQTVTMNIIADLERAPEVYAISNVKLRRLEKDGRKIVAASLVLETWFVAAKGGRA